MLFGKRGRWRAPTPTCYSSHMDSATGKQQILDALRDLPDDASVEDAIERLVFLAKVREGIAELDNDQRLEHDVVKKRFGL